MSSEAYEKSADARVLKTQVFTKIEPMKSKSQQRQNQLRGPILSKAKES